jgi:hypothetical protein
MARRTKTIDGQAGRSGVLGQPQAMRRGSLTERYQKCGKKGCPCHTDKASRHGPYYSLTRAVGGRTKTVHLRAEEAEVVRRQVEAGRRFRQELEDFWQECERCADAELEAVKDASSREAEKGGSKQRSSPASRRRSSSS